MRSLVSETLAPLIGTLAFLLLLLPVFYVWIPYEIISSKYAYLFNIGVLKYFGICFIVIGIIVGILCSIGFVVQAKGSPIPFSPTKELIVTGMYRYVRNPLYIAGSSVLIGETLLFQSLGLLIYFIFMFANFYVLALMEETVLGEKFGAKYEQYRKSVPRWIPRFEPYETNESESQ